MNNEAKLRDQSQGLLTMLGVQFILGMILNLLVQLPKVHPGTTGSYFSRAWHSFGWAVTNGGGIALLLHVLIAIGLLIGSLSLVARALAVKSRPWEIVSVVGALGVIAALTNGLAFLGYDKDANSFVMAMGFLTAAVAYSTSLSFAIRPSTDEIHVKSNSQQESGKLKLHPRH